MPNLRMSFNALLLAVLTSCASTEVGKTPPAMQKLGQELTAMGIEDGGHIAFNFARWNHTAPDMESFEDDRLMLITIARNNHEALENLSDRYDDARSRWNASRNKDERAQIDLERQEIREEVLQLAMSYGYVPPQPQEELIPD